MLAFVRSRFDPEMIWTPPPTGKRGCQSQCQSRVETKMYRVTLLGQSLMARDFNRQVTEIQVRVAMLNRYTALGIPVTVPAGSVCQGKAEPRPSSHLRNKASAWQLASSIDIAVVWHRGRARAGSAIDPANHPLFASRPWLSHTSEFNPAKPRRRGPFCAPRLRAKP